MASQTKARWKREYEENNDITCNRKKHKHNGRKGSCHRTGFKRKSDGNEAWAQIWGSEYKLLEKNREELEKQNF